MCRKILLLLPVLVYLSCNNQDSKKPANVRQSDLPAQTMPDTVSKKQPTVTALFNDWETFMHLNEIFDYVPAEDCRDNLKMEAMLAKGKFPMHVTDKKILTGHLDKDSIQDYIVSYGLDNCVHGNSSSHDFIIFSSRETGVLGFDTLATNALKSKFIAFSRQRVGKDAYAFQEDHYLFTRGLLPAGIKDHIISGDFILQGQGANCCPAIKGTFTYDLPTGKFTVTEN